MNYKQLIINNKKKVRIEVKALEKPKKVEIQPKEGLIQPKPEGPALSRRIQMTVIMKEKVL